MSAPSILVLNGWGYPPDALDPLSGRLGMPTTTLRSLFDITGPKPRKGNDAGVPSPYALTVQEALADCPAGAILIGWSTGAVIALESALHWPGAVRKLVLLSPTASFCMREDYPHGLDPAVLRDMMAGLVKGSPERVLERFFEQASEPERVAPGVTADIIRQAIERGTPALMSGLRYLLQTDLRDRIRAIRTPVLIVHGTVDAVIPFGAATWLYNHLPNAIVREYAGKGHTLPLAEPETVAGDIRTFVAS